MKLGRLEKVDLREQWKKEDTEFTPWLAREGNIEILSETIGIELEVQSQEENVGPFRADILCLDTANNHSVLIENQLEKTDHLHLGQLMTYAAGLDAVTIIWIAQRFTEEHRAALDWLNNITDDKINFFGLVIELYKIGESVPAPMFKIVSKPNDWTKSVRKTAQSQNLTETKLLQQDYWKALSDYMEENESKVKMRKPQPQNWTDISIGRSDFYLSATVSTRDNTINIWLNIGGPNAKDNFNKMAEMYEKRSFFEISEQLQWQRLENRKQSAVVLSQKGDMTDKNQWNEQFAWFKKYLEAFVIFFKPIVMKI